MPSQSGHPLESRLAELRSRLRTSTDPTTLRRTAAAILILSGFKNSQATTPAELLLPEVEASPWRGGLRGVGSSNTITTPTVLADQSNSSAFSDLSLPLGGTLEMAALAPSARSTGPALR